MDAGTIALVVGIAVVLVLIGALGPRISRRRRETDPATTPTEIPDRPVEPDATASHDRARSQADDRTVEEDRGRLEREVDDRDRTQ